LSCELSYAVSSTLCCMAFRPAHAMVVRCIEGRPLTGVEMDLDVPSTNDTSIFAGSDKTGIIIFILPLLSIISLNCKSACIIVATFFMTWRYQS
jgi:hypothetical protein